MLEAVEIIIDLVKENWKRNYSGEHEYHINDDAIDGSTREFIMKLLKDVIN